MVLLARNKAGNPSGMEVNIKKTKTILVSKTSPSPTISSTLEGSPFQQTSLIPYLGLFITEDGRCEKQVKKRI